MAIEARLAEQGQLVQTIWTDDRIALRLPEGDRPRRTTSSVDPDEIERLGPMRLAHGPPPRFRENAARALLLHAGGPGQRTPPDAAAAL
jgi:hypothetical protein